MKVWKRLLFCLGCCFILTACGTTESKDLNDSTKVDTTDTPAPTEVPEAEYTHYLFAYFIGEGVNEESIYYAVSEDGLHWDELNGGEPVLTSYLGTKGLRDPFIMRSADGTKFYMIATDLCINKNGDWWKAQSAGSRSIMIWESEDMVYWSEQRMVDVGLKTAGCAWAPEAFYDEATGEYMIFWASRTAGDGYGKQRIFYMTTKDFIDFSESKVWIDYDYDVIDATVMKEGDTYYRFLKYEGESRVILEQSDSLLGEWTLVESADLKAQSGVEGPACFELHEEDVVNGQKYMLLLDNYGGSGYYYMTADTLAEGEFERLSRKDYSMPGNKARHGTVLPITEEEYNFLLKKLKKSE